MPVGKERNGKMEKEYCTAIVLAAGSGKRMGTKVHKQYLLLGDKPVLYYSLKTFEQSDIIDEIILVTGEGEEDYCREEIVNKYNITKVSKIIHGGAERYHSVWNGLKETKEGYVYIHDGARPFVEETMIEKGYQCVRAEKACVAGVPAKDTVKIVGESGYVEDTPDRNKVWIIQTPQVFDTNLVKKAYEMLMKKTDITVTDDAMAVESMLGVPICLFDGAYENIKITTPEDLDVAQIFLKRKS